MRIGRILAGSIRAMRQNRMRTCFMMLGTFVGVAALMVILALGRGAQAQILRRFDRMFSGHTMFVRAGGGRVRTGAHGPPTTTLTLDDLRAIDSALDEVIMVDPIQMAGTREVTFEGQTRRIRVDGHAEAAEVVWNRPATRGEYFTARDVTSGARVALIGPTVERELFGGQDPVGKQIRIGGIPFQVVGVLAPMGMDPHGLDKDNEIVIPVTTLMRRVRNVDYIASAKLLLGEGIDLDATVAQVRRLLRARHALGPGQDDDFGLFTPVQVRQMVRSTNRVFTVFLPLVAALSIAIGGLVVANLMLMTVHDRRAEIGLRRALGARAQDIRLQFIAESAAVTGVGGALAVVAGYGVLLVMGRTSGVAVGIPWGPALLGLGCAIAVGLIAGVAPARRAANLDPVAALR
jgi:putative ABC transport system permease protein